jgi:hypothetical protein
MTNPSTHPLRRPAIKELHRLNQYFKKHVLDDQQEAWEEHLGINDLLTADDEYAESGSLYGKATTLVKNRNHQLASDALLESCHFHQFVECPDFWTFIVTTTPIAPKHLWMVAECNISKTNRERSCQSPQLHLVYPQNHLSPDRFFRSKRRIGPSMDISKKTISCKPTGSLLRNREEITSV